jgi:hypothetical protein
MLDSLIEVAYFFCVVMLVVLFKYISDGVYGIMTPPHSREKENIFSPIMVMALPLLVHGEVP